MEALDLPSPAPLARKSQALEALARHQPSPPETAREDAPMTDRETLTLSFRQIIISPKPSPDAHNAQAQPASFWPQAQVFRAHQS